MPDGEEPTVSPVGAQHSSVKGGEAAKIDAGGLAAAEQLWRDYDRRGGYEPSVRRLIERYVERSSGSAAQNHEHEWVDARNSVVESGEVCLGCGAVRRSPQGEDQSETMLELDEAGIEAAASAVSASAANRPRKEGTRQRFERYARAAVAAYLAQAASVSGTEPDTAKAMREAHHEAMRAHRREDDLSGFSGPQEPQGGLDAMNDASKEKP